MMRERTVWRWDLSACMHSSIASIPSEEDDDDDDEIDMDIDIDDEFDDGEDDELPGRDLLTQHILNLMTQHIDDVAAEYGTTWSVDIESLSDPTSTSIGSSPSLVTSSRLDYLHVTFTSVSPPWSNHDTIELQLTSKHKEDLNISDRTLLVSTNKSLYMLHRCSLDLVNDCSLIIEATMH